MTAAPEDGQPMNGEGLGDGAGQSAGAGGEATLLYCHCAYAKVLPTEVRDDVLSGLTDAGVAFEAVPDLCEMAARKDPALGRLAGCGSLKIAACFPRAVHWLFHGAGAPLPESGVEILNMRTRPAQEVVERALAPDIVEAVFVEPETELEELARAGQGGVDQAAVEQATGEPEGAEKS